MKTLKFRVWWQHKEYQPNGKMFFVGAISFAKQQEGEPEYNLIKNGEPVEVALIDKNSSKLGWNKAGECTIMQWTGLYDKNYREIYEGDMLLCKVYDQTLNESIEYFELVEDITLLAQHRGLYDLINANGTIEVIGNIYENKELLK